MRKAFLIPVLLVLAPLAHALADAAACVAAHSMASQSQGDQQARRDFRQCALREYGPQSESRIEACTGDLYTLPVILLYRSDGLTRAAAQADMRRGGQLDDGGDEAMRASAMLDFTYQGSGPVAGKPSEWISQRVQEWTDRCMRGLAPKTN